MAGDAEILAFLAELAFPAERCATTEPVTTLGGQALLVTEYVVAVPKRRDERRSARPAGSAASANCSESSTRSPTESVRSPGTAGPDTI